MAGMQEALNQLLNDESYRNEVLQDPAKLKNDHPSLDTQDLDQLANAHQENGGDPSWINSLTVECCCCCCP